MKINFETILKIIIMFLLLLITIGEIVPLLMNSGSTILYYLGMVVTFILIYLEYVLIKKIIQEVKNEKN